MSYQLPPPDDLDDWAEYSHGIAKDLYKAYPGENFDAKTTRMSIMTMTATWMIMQHFDRDEWLLMGQAFTDILMRNLQIVINGDV